MVNRRGLKKMQQRERQRGGERKTMIDDLDDPDIEDMLDDERLFDCGMDRQGNCGKAGSEECEFECPYRNAKRN